MCRPFDGIHRVCLLGRVSVYVFLERQADQYVPANAILGGSTVDLLPERVGDPGGEYGRGHCRPVYASQVAI